jgi:hypothetical protein
MAGGYQTSIIRNVSKTSRFETKRERERDPRCKIANRLTYFSALKKTQKNKINNRQIMVAVCAAWQKTCD